MILKTFSTSVCHHESWYLLVQDLEIVSSEPIQELPAYENSSKKGLMSHSGGQLAFASVRVSVDDSTITKSCKAETENLTKIKT